MTRLAGDRPAPEPTAPVLSVITASRGRPDALLRKAESLAGQTLRPATFEWCLWLNESPAETERIRASLNEARLPFALHVDGGADHPVGRARNVAAAAARGSILLLSDDDCTHDATALEAHAAFHATVPEAVGIGPLRLPARLRRGRRAEPFERPAAWGRRALWVNLTGANTSLPAAAFHAVGGYDAAWSGYGGEDPEFALRLRARGMRFRHVPGAGATHHGRVWDDADKAYRAGWAHRRVCDRHPGRGASWLLGVHPLVLAAKGLALHGPWSRFMDEDVRRYERAYAQGARDATRRPEHMPAPMEEQS